MNVLCNEKIVNEAAKIADDLLKELYPIEFESDWTDEMNSVWIKKYWAEVHKKRQLDKQD